ncbi:diacylglycerol O-acyltransferase [Mycobacterium sp. 1482292.6]|nr:diacylglycerol O-acyltransferase [Mycobacterium sp. 1482292.6]OBJ22722.1 diacylglycerol O-acyltransferase [Mycobacterium sp. 1245801.1]
MLRNDANPWFRAGFMAVEILDTTPDWDRVRAHAEAVSRQVLRLRQKVVAPLLPIASPRWGLDPDFNLDFHVRRIRVPEPGTLRELFDVAEVMLQSPMDVARPLWTATLVEGLADGRAAVLLHLSHALADGIGSAQMSAQIYDQERNPPSEPRTQQPGLNDPSANSFAAAGIDQRIDGAHGNIVPALSVPGLAMSEPARILGYVRSAARVLAQPAKPSPLLRHRSLSIRSEALDIKLVDLRNAASAAGGSINDAYLAGLCGALSRYHAALGEPTAHIPMVVPMNLRTGSEPAGGNRFTSVALAGPLGIDEPVERIQKIRAQLTQRRQEPAKGLINSLAPVLSRLPKPILALMMHRAAAASDVLASNVPLHPHDTYIAGAKVLRQYGLAPLNGMAIETVLLSNDGMCTVTARYDRAAIQHEKLFASCLLDGFNEILALAGRPSPRAVHVSNCSER